MLVLSRKPSEKIFIRNEAGEEIAVTVVRIGPNAVRLGIDAPRHFNIARQELIHQSTDQPVNPCEAVA